MVQSLHVKLTEGDKPRWKTLASSTNVTSANQLPGPGDHTVNDSALFFLRGYNFKTSSSYSNSELKYINHPG